MHGSWKTQYFTHLNGCHTKAGKRYYSFKGLCYLLMNISSNFEDAAKPLTIAPSTFGLTQKSPQTTNFLESQRQLSPCAILTAGKALPLKIEKQMLTATVGKEISTQTTRQNN